MFMHRKTRLMILRECFIVVPAICLSYCSPAFALGKFASFPELKADIRLRLGIYREEGLKSSAIADLLKKKKEGDATGSHGVANPRILLNDKGNYAALVDITYLLNAQMLGNFGTAVGYSYRSEVAEQNPLTNIKYKVKALSLPYAELSWEKSGILFIEKMTFRSCATVLGKKEKGKGLPLHFSAGLAYKIGGMTSIYAGMQFLTHFPSFQTEEKDNLKAVLGMEFAL